MPATVPSWPVPVASDLKVTSLPPKSATPPAAMLKVLPGLMVRVPVPLRVSEPVMFKSVLITGFPDEMMMASDPLGTAPLHQLEGLFHKFELFPTQEYAIETIAAPVKFEMDDPATSVTETKV